MESVLNMSVWLCRTQLYSSSQQSVPVWWSCEWKWRSQEQHTKVALIIDLANRCCIWPHLHHDL